MCTLRAFELGRAAGIGGECSGGSALLLHMCAKFSPRVCASSSGLGDLRGGSVSLHSRADDLDVARVRVSSSGHKRACPETLPTFSFTRELRTIVHYSSPSPASRSVHVASAWSAGSTGMPRSSESMASAKAARMSVYLRREGGDVCVVRRLCGTCQLQHGKAARVSQPGVMARLRNLWSSAA